MRECMRGREEGRRWEQEEGMGKEEKGERGKVGVRKCMRGREEGEEGGRGKGGGVRECMRGNEEGRKVGGGRRMGEGGTRREIEGREREGGIGSCVV